MILANENFYLKTLELLKTIPVNTLFAQAVLEKKVNGFLYVDNLENPMTFYIYHPYGMAFLFGDNNNESFNFKLIKYMTKNENRKKTEWLQVYPSVWEKTLEELLKDKIIYFNRLSEELNFDEKLQVMEIEKNEKITVWNRVNFEYRGDYHNLSVENPMKIIDSELLDTFSGTVVPLEFWKSKETFLELGFGFSLFSNSNCASIAFSSCINNKYLEIGIETDKDYRKKGYAKEVAKTLINYSISIGKTPVWACKKENLGSYNLAKSLGFEEIRILPYYELIK